MHFWVKGFMHTREKMVQLFLLLYVVDRIGNIIKQFKALCASRNAFKLPNFKVLAFVFFMISCFFYVLNLFLHGIGCCINI